jgi:hypothetical protein
VTRTDMLGTGGSRQDWVDGTAIGQGFGLLKGIASIILLYWVGGVVEALTHNEHMEHKAGAKYGIPGQVAWVSAMRIVCLIPMAALGAWAAWGGGGKWQAAVAEDEDATIAYWRDHGL